MKTPKIGSTKNKVESKVNLKFERTNKLLRSLEDAHSVEKKVNVLRKALHNEELVEEIYCGSLKLTDDFEEVFVKPKNVAAFCKLAASSNKYRNNHMAIFANSIISVLKNSDNSKIRHVDKVIETLSEFTKDSMKPYIHKLFKKCGKFTNVKTAIKIFVNIPPAKYMRTKGDVMYYVTELGLSLSKYDKRISWKKIEWIEFSNVVFGDRASVALRCMIDSELFPSKAIINQAYKTCAGIAGDVVKTAVDIAKGFGLTHNS